MGYPEPILFKAIRFLRRLFPPSARFAIRQMLFRWLDLRWTLASGILIRIENYADWVVYNEIFVDGAYDAAIRMAVESSGKHAPLRVIDLGANVGFFALRVVDLLRRDTGDSTQFTIDAIEGNPALIAGLHSRLITDNSLSRHVRIIPGLIGERGGKATLYKSYSHSHGSIIPGSGTHGPSVPYVDLSRLFSPEAQFDLLKCDIEGAELLFIERYPDLLQRVRVAVFELHDHLSDSDRCRALLKDLGFSGATVVRDTHPCSLYCVWR